MKSERRHDLQHNELAEWLAKIFNAVQPHANMILIGLLLVLGVYGAVKIWSIRSGDSTARAWDSFYAAMNSGELAGLDKVSEDNADNEVGDWALLVGADLRLANGCDQLFGNKIVAGQELRKAMESYTAVLGVSKVSSIRERATFGLARTYEALAATRRLQGELQKAEQMYQEVVDKWSDGVYAKAAQRRLDDLGRVATEEFYDQLAAYDPEPAFDPASAGLGDVPFDASGLSPGSIPRDISDLLGSPGSSGDDAAKDDTMDSDDQEKAEPTDSKPVSDTPEGQPAPEQAEKGSDADSAEKAEPAPPATEDPAKTDTE